MPFLLLFVLLFSPLLQATPPPIQLASKFQNDIDINQYWVSEKLDGVRAYWDGQQLISRQGNPFSAPQWFVKHFPVQPLDGELWIARGQFERISGIVRSQKVNEQAWLSISFMIFDLPNSKEKFTTRLSIMQQLVNQSQSPYLKIITQQKFSSLNALQKQLDTIIDAGGEGLMLHHGEAYYQAKRSQDLMKLKRHEDDEALVIGHIAGKGRHLGRMGALLVQNSEGIIFKVGSGFSDIERENPPQIGDTITYQFIGKTNNNVPRFATFLRIRYKNKSTQ